MYEIDLWLRYKSKAVDLVWFNRTCKVSLRAGRGRVSGRGGGISFPIRIAARLGPIVLPPVQVWLQEIEEGNREREPIAWQAEAIERTHSGIVVTHG